MNGTDVVTKRMAFVIKYYGWTKGTNTNSASRPSNASLRWIMGFVSTHCQFSAMTYIVASTLGNLEEYPFRRELGVLPYKDIQLNMQHTAPGEYRRAIVHFGHLLSGFLSCPSRSIWLPDKKNRED